MCVRVCVRVCRSLTDLCRNEAQSIDGRKIEETDVIVVGSVVAGLLCVCVSVCLSVCVVCVCLCVCAGL